VKLTAQHIEAYRSYLHTKLGTADVEASRMLDELVQQSHRTYDLERELKLQSHMADHAQHKDQRRVARKGTQTGYMRYPVLVTAREHGYTWDKIATVCEVPITTVYRWNARKDRPTALAILRLAHHLETT